MKGHFAIGVFGAALFALGTAAPAGATVITFDDLSNGDIVTTQYPGVTFSSEVGSNVFVTAQNLGTSLPNFICSGVNSINCVDDVYLDFASGVSGLSFFGVGIDDAGDVGDVRVYSGATLLGTIDITGSADPLTPFFVDLTAFAAVTRIEIADITDTAGIGYDDFSFNGRGEVPEPATWAMMLLGFGAVGAAMRRRKLDRQVLDLA